MVVAFAGSTGPGRRCASSGVVSTAATSVKPISVRLGAVIVGSFVGVFIASTAVESHQECGEPRQSTRARLTLAGAGIADGARGEWCRKMSGVVTRRYAILPPGTERIVAPGADEWHGDGLMRIGFDHGHGTFDRRIRPRDGHRASDGRLVNHPERVMSLANVAGSPREREQGHHVDRD